MAMSFVSMWMMLISAGLGQQGSNQLIDYIPVDAYWQSKGVAVNVANMTAELKPSAPVAALDAEAIQALREAAGSKDPAIAQTAKAMLAKQFTGGQSQKVRRLMAIKALAGMDEPAAKAALEGEDLTVVAAPNAEARAKDVGLLPAEVGVVAQVVLNGRDHDPVAEIIKKLPAQYAEQAKQIPAMIIEHFLPIVEQTGNVRLDSITFGLSETIARRQTFAVLIARGQYDPQAMAFVLSDKGIKSETVEGMEVFRPDHEAAILLVDPSLAVMVIMDGKESRALEGIIANIKAGKGTLEQNKPMMELLGKIDRGAPVWAVAKISESYRQAPFINAFESITLTGEEREGTPSLVMRAFGEDAEKVAAAASFLQSQLDQAIANMDRMEKDFPQNDGIMRSLREMIQSVKIAREDGELNITMDTMPNPASLLMPFLGMRAMRVEHEIPSQQ